MSDHINRYRQDFKEQANLRNGTGQRVDRIFGSHINPGNGAFVERLPCAGKTSQGIGAGRPAPFMLGHSALGGPDSLGGA